MPLPAAVRASTFTVLLACSALALAQAQRAPAKFTPEVGQPGKDVVWVPTPQAVVNKMLDMAKLTPQDFLIDLGSGDGRTVITAAKRGAHALGIEFNPDMVELSRANARSAGVTERANFVRGDLFQQDLSKANIITMFLLPDINLKLRPKLLALKPGTRVVSNTFTMGEWRPDETGEVEKGCDGSWCTALLWIVPARVEGNWKLPQGDLTLHQAFQMLSGTLESGGKSLPVEGRVHGEDVVLNAGGHQYRGRMSGGQLELR